MMDDETRRKLAALAREEAEAAGDDAAWIDRARGDLGAAPRPRDAEHARLLEAATRPDAGADDRLVAAALAATATRTAATTGSVASLDARRRRAQLAWAAVPILAAAAAAVLLLRPAPGPGARDDALPAYALAFEGAEDATRGEDGSVPTRRSIAPGAKFRMIARPAAPVVGALEARAFARCGARDLAILTNLEIAPSGAARLEGTPGELLGRTRGDCTLLLAVGRRGALPTTPTAADALATRGAGRADVIVVRQDLRVTEAP